MKNILDYTLIVLFLIFIIFQIQIPDFIAVYIDTPFGIGIVAIAAFYMFFYTHPILGILGLIVAYEILRRSSLKTGKYAIPAFLPSQEKRDITYQNMNSPSLTGANPSAGSGKTLEEQVIADMAPIGNTNKPNIVSTSFKPLNETTIGTPI